MRSVRTVMFLAMVHVQLACEGRVVGATEQRHLSCKDSML